MAVQQLAQYMLQVGLEAEATAFLGRDHYRRGDRLRLGWRNGYEPKQLRTEAGALVLPIPQLRGTPDRFTPVLAEQGRERWNSRRWSAACTCAGC